MVGGPFGMVGEAAVPRSSSFDGGVEAPPSPFVIARRKTSTFRLATSTTSTGLPASPGLDGVELLAELDEMTGPSKVDEQAMAPLVTHSHRIPPRPRRRPGEAVERFGALEDLERAV
jgi:hypothetical protein